MSRHPERPRIRTGDLIAVKWDDGYTYFQLVAYPTFGGAFAKDAGTTENAKVPDEDILAIIESDGLDQAAMMKAMQGVQKRLNKAGHDVWIDEDQASAFYTDMVELRSKRLPTEYEKIELLTLPDSLALIERAFESAQQAKSYRSVAFWNPVKAELPRLAYEYLWSCYCSLAREVKDQPRLTEILKAVHEWSQEENRGVQEWYGNRPIN